MEDEVRTWATLDKKHCPVYSWNCLSLMWPEHTGPSFTWKKKLQVQASVDETAVHAQGEQAREPSQAVLATTEGDHQLKALKSPEQGSKVRHSIRCEVDRQESVVVSAIRCKKYSQHPDLLELHNQPNADS